MLRGLWVGVATGAALLALAGCTSSGSPHAASSGPTSTPPSDPSTSAPVTPSMPAPTNAPLSPFEKDPAVKAMRAWATQAARTINTGHYTDAELRSLMTPAFAKTMKNILGGEVGYRYPGPLPLQPEKVRVTSATSRIVKVCDVYQGFSVNPKTGKPAQKYAVAPANIYVSQVSGRWLVDNLTRASDFSCSGVKVAKPKW